MSGSYRRRKRRVPRARLEASQLAHLHDLGCTCREVAVTYNQHPAYGEVQVAEYGHDDDCPLISGVSVMVIPPETRRP